MTHNPFTAASRRHLVGALFAALPLVATAQTAVGHEPGWRAQLDAARFDFQADDGTRFALDVDARPRPGAPVQLGLQLKGEPLLLRTEAALCHDLRTGLPYPWRLSVTLSGRVYLGCGGDPASLLRGEWRQGEQSLRFEANGEFSAQTGCNQLRGRYVADAQGLQLSPGPMTRRACWGASQAEAENRFIALLPQVLRFDIADDGALQLRSLDGSVLRLLKAAD